MSETSQASNVNRRQFLTRSGAAAAGAAVIAGGLPAVHAAEDNPIRLPLIGCGGRGNGAVANAMNTRLDPFIVDVFGNMPDYRPLISLDGQWDFAIDESNNGYDLNWHIGQGDFTQTITIPGAPQAQGIGAGNERQKTFFWKEFWLRTLFKVEPIQPNQRLWLKLGGIFPAGQIYINGNLAGYTKSNRTPLRIDITAFVIRGQDNLIAIKICDMPEVRLDGLWEDSTFGKSWSGLYRGVSLEITDTICINDLLIVPMFDQQAVNVEIILSDRLSQNTDMHLAIRDNAETVAEHTVQMNGGRTKIRTTIPFNTFTPWSIATPKLYTLTASVGHKDAVAHQFGMRKLSVEGTKFHLNNIPLFVKAFGDDHYYLDTLAPPADKQWYVERLQRAKDYGMNAVKSCVDVIPKDYMQAADEVGMLVIQEMPFGLSGTYRETRHNINEVFREYYTTELDKIVKMSRNHASVFSYSMTSELGIWSQTQQSFDFFNRFLVARTRRLAPNSIVTDGTGYIIPKHTTLGLRDTDWSSKGHIFRDVFDDITLEFDTVHPHPVVLHEYNWWSNYPDPANQAKYLTTQYKPFWYSQLYSTAQARGQAESIDLYHENSVWLQALCRKEGLEYARRIDVEGYILWLLIDLNQWSEGLFDDWWNPKNVTAEEFLQYNADTIIIMSEDKNRCFAMGDVIEIPLAVRHYGSEDIHDISIDWAVVIGEETVAQGCLNTGLLPIGQLTQVGLVQTTLPLRPTAYKCELQVEITGNGQKINTNHWDLWAFEETGTARAGVSTTSETISYQLGNPEPSGINENTALLITNKIDHQVLTYLQNGGNCILLSKHAHISNNRSDCQFFRTIPWNRGSSGNSGTVIANHPSLADFPHDQRCDLQFINLIKGIYPLEIDSLTQYGLKPIIRVIDHYKSNRNKAYLLEFNVGTGKVLVTTLAIESKLETNIEARYLLQCLIKYARSDVFSPDVTIPANIVLQSFQQQEGGRHPE